MLLWGNFTLEFSLLNGLRASIPVEEDHSNYSDYSDNNSISSIEMEEEKEGGVVYYQNLANNDWQLADGEEVGSSEDFPTYNPRLLLESNDEEEG